MLRFALVSFQLFEMSLWNYGPDVMDALIELIISLVCFCMFKNYGSAIGVFRAFRDEFAS